LPLHARSDRSSIYYKKTEEIKLEWIYTAKTLTVLINDAKTKKLLALEFLRGL